MIGIKEFKELREKSIEAALDLDNLNNNMDYAKAYDDQKEIDILNKLIEETKTAIKEYDRLIEECSTMLLTAKYFKSEQDFKDFYKLDYAEFFITSKGIDYIGYRDYYNGEEDVREYFSTYTQDQEIMEDDMGLMLDDSYEDYLEEIVNKQTHIISYESFKDIFDFKDHYCLDYVDTYKVNDKFEYAGYIDYDGYEGHGNLKEYFSTYTTDQQIIEQDLANSLDQQTYDYYHSLDDENIFYEVVLDLQRRQTNYLNELTNLEELSNEAEKDFNKDLLINIEEKQNVIEEELEMLDRLIERYK